MSFNFRIYLTKNWHCNAVVVVFDDDDDASLWSGIKYFEMLKTPSQRPHKIIGMSQFLQWTHVRWLSLCSLGTDSILFWFWQWHAISSFFVQWIGNDDETIQVIFVADVTIGKLKCSKWFTNKNWVGILRSNRKTNLKTLSLLVSAQFYGQMHAIDSSLLWRFD